METALPDIALDVLLDEAFARLDAAERKRRRWRPKISAAIKALAIIAL